MLLALAQGVGHAATITVTTNIPAVNGADGKCSLIEAIDNANAGALTHANCAAGDAGANIIVLPKATHAIGAAVSNPMYEATGLPVITSQITIEGNDAKITRKATASRFRLITVGATGDLTLRNVTLSGGNAADYGGAIHNQGLLTIQNSTISSNDAGYEGGGVSSAAGWLTIENSTISGNTVGKKASSYLGDGGGIAVFSGTATIMSSTISGNQAAGVLASYAAGISNSGSMTIDNSTISGNKADAYLTANGAGIGNYGDLTITNSTISGNIAAGKVRAYGGGIYNNGTLTIRSSTISANKATDADAAGGGIANFGTATVENSTISGNKANGKYGYGGGISNANTLTIANSTISGNVAGANGYGGGIESVGDLVLHRSLISGNKAGAAPEVDNSGGTVTADNFNLFGSKGNAGVLGVTPGPSDIVPDGALAKILAPLASNGGPTKTHALKPDSPAVNAIPSSDPACTGADQRGVTRPQPPGSNCDIGAFELE